MGSIFSSFSSNEQERKAASSPSHPGLFTVEFKPGDFNSRLVADKVGYNTLYCTLIKFLQGYAQGEIICYLEGLTKGPKAYSSVQYGIGEDENFELNSDLVYSELLV